MLRCACPTRFNVLKRTPQLFAFYLRSFEQPVNVLFWDAGETRVSLILGFAI
jgi:hypothetical protein